MDTSQNQNNIQIRTTLNPGDIGNLIQLHGILYAEEYNWDHTFEAYVAEGLARFVLDGDAERSRLWIAEMDGSIVGCIAIAADTATEAQLRWYLVHPDSRGQGLGWRLMDEAINFCQEIGYESVFLWTTSDLVAAAHVYGSVGFHKTEEKTHEVWGQTITEERYDLTL